MASARRLYDPPLPVPTPDHHRRDRRLLYATVLARALSIGLLGVLLAQHLERRDFDEAEIGYVVSAGLWGMAATTIAVGAWADRIGRRRSLVALALLTAAGVVAASFAPPPSLAIAAARVGLVH